MVSRALVAALCSSLVGFVGLCSSPSETAANGFTRALTDDVWFDTIGRQWIPRTESTGAKLVLLEIDWANVEPTAPAPTDDPTNPADPQFNFRYVDVIVKRFQGTGIQPAFLVTDAPGWAEAPGGPADLEQDGAWEPNATRFGQLGTALARRYSGSYPDPAAPGRTLPRVRYFQAWAEANFSVHLAPQWRWSGGAWVPASPGIYRTMLNAFYAGIKSVHSDNLVVTEGSGPYGDLLPGGCAGGLAPDVGNGCRMPPVEFARELMCLHGEALRPESCPNPAHFDALAIDPYEIGGPSTHAFAIDDVSAPDLGKLTRVLNKAVPLGLAVPTVSKQLWVTEFGYQSNPPDPLGVPLTTQAHWLEQAFYLFWRQGVSTAVWYLVRDESDTYTPGGLTYTGLFFNNATPKPAVEAFRFPFVVASSGHFATVWGISPRTGSVAVERQTGSSWKTLFHIKVSAGNVFVHKVSAGLHGNFRGVVRGETSLVWNR